MFKLLKNFETRILILESLGASIHNDEHYGNQEAEEEADVADEERADGDIGDAAAGVDSPRADA